MQLQPSLDPVAHRSDPLPATTSFRPKPRHHLRQDLRPVPITIRKPTLEPRHCTRQPAPGNTLRRHGVIEPHHPVHRQSTLPDRRNTEFGNITPQNMMSPKQRRKLKTIPRKLQIRASRNHLHHRHHHPQTKKSSTQIAHGLTRIPHPYPGRHKHPAPQKKQQRTPPLRIKRLWKLVQMHHPQQFGLNQTAGKPI